MKIILPLLLMIAFAEAIIFVSCKKSEITPIAGNCDEVSIKIINGPGTLSLFGSLTQAKAVQPATAADKIVFAGGVIENSNSTDQVDIYNLTTNTWSVAKLSSTHSGENISIGNKILFRTSGGFDVYDAVANTWSLLSVDQQIMQRGPTTVAANNKLFFAGGSISNDSASSRVDIYDMSTNTWSTAALSEARTGINAIAVGSKVIFAGGFKRWNPVDYPEVPSVKVDIYDLVANAWSTAEMPQPGFLGNSASAGTKAFFSFENNSNSIFIYDITSNSWSTALLSQPRHFPKIISVGNKILITGGIDIGGNASRVNIYDVLTNTWSFASLSRPGTVSWVVSSANKLLIDTYQDDGSSIVSTKWDIYDALNNSWSSIELNYKLLSFPVVAGNQIFFGGGAVCYPGSPNTYPTCKVWKFQF